MPACDGTAHQCACMEPLVKISLPRTWAKGEPMNNRKNAVLIAMLTIFLFTPHASARFVYQLDDGRSFGGYAPHPYRTATVLNQFTVSGGNRKITSVLMGSERGKTGHPVTAGVWSDPNQDGLPDDAQLLGSITQGYNHPSLGDLEFLRFDLITPVDVGPAGTSFFVGLNWSSGDFIFGEEGFADLKIDLHSPREDRTFQLVTDTPHDLNDLPGIALAEWEAFIRAEAVPEPSSILLFGMAGWVFIASRWRSS